MQFKGTPGPWVLKKVGRSNPAIGNCGSHELNINVEMWFGDCFPVKTSDEAIANSNLITAAPDMLDALQKLMAVYEDKGQLLSFNVDIARQALAKALGEEVAHV